MVHPAVHAADFVIVGAEDRASGQSTPRLSSQRDSQPYCHASDICCQEDVRCGRLEVHSGPCEAQALRLPYAL